MADTIQRNILTIYLEPNKPIRGAVARMDTLKLVITVKDADMKPIDLSDYRLVLTATDSEKTVFWDVYTVDAANGVVAAEVQPDVVGRNEYRLKVVLSDTSEVTFFAGAIAVAVENVEDGPVATIDSMTRRMLDAIKRAEEVQGVQGEKGDLGDKGDSGDKGDPGDKGDTGEVSQADFDTLSATVNTNTSTIAKKADTTTVNTAIAKKADTTALDTLAAEVLKKSSQADLNALMAKVVAQAIPVGSVWGFAMTAIPNDFIIANGAELNPVVYKNLVAALGKTKLPDYRGKFLRGDDSGAGVDKGRVFGTTQGDAIRNIVGTTLPVQYSTSVMSIANTGAITTSTASTGTVGHSGTSYLGTTIKQSFNASLVVPTAAENRPINETVVWCIKY